MNPVGILYATREGQTGRIAEYIALGLEARGFETELINLTNRVSIHFDKYAAILLASPVHAGKHEPAVLQLVKEHRRELGSLPNALVSVTLSEAGAERASSTVEERGRFAADVQKMIDAFVNETGWRPKRVKPVAGALLYSKYNFFIRFIMKRIAREVGAETDTSRDYEYTDWRELDRFIDEFADEISWSQGLRRIS